MTEAQIKAKVLLNIGGEPRCRLFNNPVGEGWIGETIKVEGGNVLLARARRVTFGLSVGSPDTVGWRQVVVTPAMVGHPLAVFLGMEIKTATGKRSPEQIAFARILRAAGGLVGVARSVEEARRIALLDAFP